MHKLRMLNLKQILCLLNLSETIYNKEQKLKYAIQ